LGDDRGPFPHVLRHELTGTQVRPGHPGSFEIALDFRVHSVKEKRRSDGRVQAGELDDLARPPFDNRISQSACPIVNIDNPFAHHLTICEGDDPGVSLELGVNHELLRKTCVDGAHVADAQNVFCWCVDRDVLAN
jgi:hypothetical protein